MNLLKKYRPEIIIILSGIILYIPFIGGVHLFDWDEINFAESAREMIVSGNYLDVQINFRPFWEKPPLFIWMQVLSMKIFGITEFAARFPNAVCGIITLLVLFRAGRKFRDERFGWIWVMTYAGSVLPLMYFKSGIIDPWFNLFIFLGIIFFIYYLNGTYQRTKDLVISAVFLGLAVLTKGPVALLIFTLGFIIYLFYKRFRINTSLLDVFIFTAVLAFTGGFWFILQVFSGNMDIIRDFITYQVRLFKTEDAGHGGFLFYHFIVLFVGVFPASVFALFAFFRRETDNSGNNDLNVWMHIVFFVVLLLFSIVKTKIVHYSSMCYFPLTFIAALGIYRLFRGDMHAGRLLRFMLIILTLFFGILVIAVSFTDVFKENIISHNLVKDDFALGNLEASGNWTGFESLVGIFYLASGLYFIRRFNIGPLPSVIGIFLTNMVFGFLTMTVIAPRVEAYSQRAAVEFYESVSGEEAYITTLGFKSYAQLFYGQVKVPSDTLAADKDWLLKGNIDKPVFIVFKINRKARYLREYPGIRLLYEKNGFVFARRDLPINENK